MSNMVTVKAAARELEEKMKEYGYIKDDSYDDDSTARYKLSLNLKHKSLVPKEVKQSYISQGINFGVFFKDFINSCIEMQSLKSITDDSEDTKTVFIRTQLTARNYDALDQTLRGQSGSGIQAGEVYLLILDNEKTPFCIVEALCLNSVDKTNIDLHINKITKYDANGIKWNIVLSYVTTADFQAFTDRYINYVKDADFEYPISNIKDYTNLLFSEMRVFSSTFERSGMDRELIHVLLKMPS